MLIRINIRYVRGGVKHFLHTTIVLLIIRFYLVSGGAPSDDRLSTQQGTQITVSHKRVSTTDDVF